MACTREPFCGQSFLRIAVLLFLTACDGDDRDASAQPLPEPPAVQVAIFGDSIVQAMAGSNPVAPFDRALNAGISGQTTEEIADRVTAAARATGSV
jgi:hypothetical protein